MHVAPRAVSAWPSKLFVGLSLLLTLSARAIRLLHLQSRAQFQAVLDGRPVARTAHFALHLLALEKVVNRENQAPLFGQMATWVGAMAPKRWAKRAVTRNAIKRQVYSVCQEYEPLLTPAAHVVRLRCGFDREKFVSASSPLLKRAVRLELIELFDRLVQTRAKAVT